MPQLSKALLRSLAIWPALFLAACGLGGPAHDAALPGTGGVVDMGFESFNPTIVYVRAGQTVEWRNKSIITHSVTDDPKLALAPSDAASPAGVAPFMSGDIAAGDTFTHVFAAPGTYKYFCTHHEDMGMVGTVVVTP